MTGPAGIRWLAFREQRKAPAELARMDGTDLSRLRDGTALLVRDDRYFGDLLRDIDAELARREPAKETR